MKITAVIRKGSTDRRKDGTFPIYARIAAGTTSYKSLKIAVKPEHWIESEGMVSKQHPQHKALNAIITARITELEQSGLELLAKSETFRAGDIKAKAGQAQYVDFISYAKAHNDRYKEDHFTSKKKIGQLAVLLRFAPGLTWQGITPAFLRSYIASMKGQAPVTIMHKLKYIRQIINEAHRDKVFRYEEPPFVGLKLTARSTPKEGLSLAELNAFRAVQCSGWVERAKLIFLLQYNLIGMRIGDLLTIRSNQLREGRLYYMMNKSKDYFALNLKPEAVQIIEQLSQPGTYYLLPLIKEQRDRKKIGEQIESLTAKINASLKIVALRAGIDRPISTHYARRTWAKLAKGIPGTSPFLIRDSLGHSSVATTELYTDTDMDLINELNSKLG